MNPTVRTILVFLALVAAIVGASLMYRKIGAPAQTSAETEPVALDESTLQPETRIAVQAEREGRGDEALEHFLAIPGTSPDYPLALERIAVILARRGQYVDAQARIFELMHLFPGDAEPHGIMGWLFYLDEDYDRAELAALRALELDPGHLSSRYNIGLFRVAQGRSQRAVASYTRAMRDDPSGRKIALHRERLRAFHDEHPEQAATHYVLAFVAGSMQDHRTEIEELQHFIEIAPLGPELKAAHIKLKQTREAVGAS